MSHTTTREHIKAAIDHLDPAALQSIGEIIDRAKRQPAAVLEPVAGSSQNRAGQAAGSSQSLQFIGENLTLEEYESLPLEERGLLNLRLKEKNHHWLQKKFSALKAAWLVVVDGEVIDSGKSLKDEPMPPQILKICRNTGKFPFVFINDAFLAIEESASTWHETNEPEDFYPTLPISLSSTRNTVGVISDFDTGAARTFAAYDFLLAENLIQPEIGDTHKASRHLNQPYFYVTKFVRFKLSSLNVDAKIYCVLNWQMSPFVAINPNRIALIGRDILLKLKPKVLLDFQKRQTEIGVPLKSSQPRRKNNVRKKYKTRSRR